jgi:hypothetical protein
MKAFTVTQPWGYAIAHLGKSIENRAQKTTYRGPVLIHVGLTMNDPAAIHLRLLGYVVDPDVMQRQLGKVIGVTELVDCCRPPGCHHSPTRWATNAWHWVLGQFIAFEEPIAYRGQLGLWTFPDELLKGVDLTTGKKRD